MLTARKFPRACLSCRLQLLSIFENGFTNAATPSARTRRAFSIASKFQSSGFPKALGSRNFSTTRHRRNDAGNEPAAPEAEPSAAEIEDVVRQTRQTFGETLPKDYLTAAEYVVYERLYGAPLRETRPEDLEYLPEVPNDDLPQTARNMLLRSGRNGLEEVETNQKLTYSIEDGEGLNEQLKDTLEDETTLAEAGIEDSEFSDRENSILAELADRLHSEPGAIVEDDVQDEVETLERDETGAFETEEFVGSDDISEEEIERYLREESGEEVIEDQLQTTHTPEEARKLSIDRREREVIARLQKDMEAALAKVADEAAAAEPVEEEIEEDAEEEVEEYEEEAEDWEHEERSSPEDYTDMTSGEIRTHPRTMTGRSGTIPSTLFLPNEAFVAPVNEMVTRTDWKHLTTAAEKAFGGKGLPYSTSTPRSGRLLPQKHIGLDAMQHSMSEMEADSYISVIMPGTFAAATSTLTEVRKRLGKDWVRDMIFRQDGTGPRVLDAGGAGSGALAWRDIVQAEWEVLKEEGVVEGDDAPTGKTTVLVGANTLRYRVSQLLENTTFLPRLPDYVHASSNLGDELIDAYASTDRKKFDVIIAPHTLFPLKEDYKRKNMVENLWSMLDPEGGVLILIEKGVPRGFEAIAGAREYLLKKHIASPGETEYAAELSSPSDERFVQKETGMIIAPCTNHNDCPMYPIPGLTYGRKDFCHFSQRYIRPPFLQRVLGAKSRNHEDVKFSYIALRRGIDMREYQDGPFQGAEAAERAFEGYEESEEDDVQFHPLSLPRAIMPPIKRTGHVTLDLCTPAGKLERWVVPKSFSKTAYRDARKSQWGDLWALGAKTRVERKARLGNGGTDPNAKSQKLKGIRDGKNSKTGKKIKTNRFNLIVGKDGMMEGIELDEKQVRKMRVMPQKRNKRGKIYKDLKSVSEEDLG